MYYCVVYLYVNGSGSITSVGEERLICLLLFTCNYVVSVWRGFLFLWVLGMGYINLLRHSLSLPYNYFGFREVCEGFSEVCEDSRGGCEGLWWSERDLREV